MHIYFTIMSYEQWQPPIKGFTPWQTVALFVEGDDVVDSPSSSYHNPQVDNRNIHPPRTRLRKRRRRGGGYAILVHKRFTSQITNVLISALSTSSTPTSSDGACSGDVEWKDVTGYEGKGREKSYGPSKKHAENGDDDDDVASVSGSGSVSDSQKYGHVPSTRHH